MRRNGIIRLDGSEDKIKQKRKPAKPYVQAEWITDYMKNRDRCIYLDPKTDDETKKSILERWVK